MQGDLLQICKELLAPGQLVALYLVKWWARTNFSAAEKTPSKDFFFGLEVSEHEEVVVYLFLHFLRHSKKVMTIHRHQIDYKRAYQY